MAKDLAWAAKTILELAKIPATPKLVAAFSNYDQNRMWIKGVLKTAAPSASMMSNPYYQEAIAILKANGISDNIYDTGS